MATTGSAARWERLAATLAHADIHTNVDTTNYPGGRSYSITLHYPGIGNICIHDAWWRKNADIWIGWQVWAEDREGITLKEWPRTKKRSEVVAAVRAAQRCYDTVQAEEEAPR